MFFFPFVVEIRFHHQNRAVRRKQPLGQRRGSRVNGHPAA
jgi:hypothetical protein